MKRLTTLTLLMMVLVAKHAVACPSGVSVVVPDSKLTVKAVKPDVLSHYVSEKSGMVHGLTVAQLRAKEVEGAACRTISFGYPEQYVYIAEPFDAMDCQLEVILNHEIQHAQINNIITNNHKDQLQHALLSAQSQQEEQVILSYFAEKIMAEQNHYHAHIDQGDHYLEAFEQCGGHHHG